MDNINSIGLALDPAMVPSFLLDWEVTKRCNLDCSYCGTIAQWGEIAGHDNGTDHPPLEECLKTIDFMYEYVDLYMKHKKPLHRKVVLNVYGGESLFHPDIVEILESCRSKYQPYSDKWHLTVACTTNAIVGENQWEKIMSLVDNFTLSYHSEALPKQKQIFKNNALKLKAASKPFKVVAMMHNKEPYWKDCVDALDFFKENDISHVAKPLDNIESEWSYTTSQFEKFKPIWINRVSTNQKSDYQNLIDGSGKTERVQSITEGRACCGGRKLSINGNLKSSVSFVPRQGFKGWSCSVNWFFLFVRQLDGKIYTNKDCRTSTTGIEEPLGNLSDYQSIIDTLRKQLDTNSMPIIQCVKDICRCGFCSPKAESRNDFMELIKRTVVDNVFKIN